LAAFLALAQNRRSGKTASENSSHELLVENLDVSADPRETVSPYFTLATSAQIKIFLSL
jgi:hypothetical protein